MATLTGASFSSSSYMCLTNVLPPFSSTSFPILLPNFSKVPRDSSFSLASPVTGRRKVRFNPSFARDREFGDLVEMRETTETTETTETRLYSLAPFPLLFVAALPGGTYSFLLLFSGLNPFDVVLKLSACLLFVSLLLQSTFTVSS